MWRSPEAPAEHAGFGYRKAPEMHARPHLTFELFVDDSRYSVPTLHLIEAPDEAAATAIARRILAESIHHRGAELCRQGERLIGLGTLATRRLPRDGGGPA